MKPAMLLVLAACGGAQTATVPSDVDVEALAYLARSYRFLAAHMDRKP